MVWKLSAGLGSAAAARQRTTASALAAPPAATRLAPDDDREASTGRHHVVAGDSYWSIARSRLGDGAPGTRVWDYTQALMEANARPSRLRGSGDAAPRRRGRARRSGRIELRASGTGSASADAAVPQVTVEAGDSYWAIAERDAWRRRGSPRCAGADQRSDRPEQPAARIRRPADGPARRCRAPAGSAHDPAAAGDPRCRLRLPARHPRSSRSTQWSRTSQQLRPAALPTPRAPSTSTTTTTTSTVPTPTDPDAAAADADAGRPSRSPSASARRRSSPLASWPSSPPSGEHGCALRNRRRVCRCLGRRLRRPSGCFSGSRTANACSASTSLCGPLASVVAATDHRVVAVRSAPDGTIEVTTSGAVALGEPWTGSDRVWTLSRIVPVDDLAAQARSVGAPCIALVQLGVDELRAGTCSSTSRRSGCSQSTPTDRPPTASSERSRSVSPVPSSLRSLTSSGSGSTRPCSSATARHRPSARSTKAWSSRPRWWARPARRNEARSRSALATSGWRGVGTGRGARRVSRSRFDRPERSPHRSPAAAVSRSSRPDPFAGASWDLHAGGATWTLDPLGIRLLPVGIDSHEVAALIDAIDGDPPVAGGQPPPHEFRGARSRACRARVARRGPRIPRRGHGRAGPRVRSCLDPRASSSRRAATGSTSLRDHGNQRRHVRRQRALDGARHGRRQAGRRSRLTSIVDPPWALMVRLMGPVDVVDTRGAAAKFERSKTLELLAWMVTHRERSTRIAARTALWDQDVRRRDVRQRRLRGAPRARPARRTARRR